MSRCSRNGPEVMAMWDGHDGMGWWMVWGSLFWTVLLIAMIYLVARFGAQPASRRREQHDGNEAPREDPIEIARRRYASGEIAREEFERLRSDLRDSS